MVVVRIFLGIWYLQLGVGTKINPLCSIYDNAGHVGDEDVTNINKLKDTFIKILKKDKWRKKTVERRIENEIHSNF